MKNQFLVIARSGATWRSLFIVEERLLRFARNDATPIFSTSSITCHAGLDPASRWQVRKRTLRRLKGGFEDETALLTFAGETLGGVV